jgi:hypothetical protein
MPKQYGSNGVNSDGSLMNVGNSIWDPLNGGRPSIKVYSDKNAYAPTTPPWLIGGTFEEDSNDNKKQNVNNQDQDRKIVNNKIVNNQDQDRKIVNNQDQDTKNSK